MATTPRPMPMPRKDATADLTNGANNSGAAAGDFFSSIENLTGSAFDDALRGDQVRNVLEGSAGADQLFGLAGNDTIRGGDGSDFIDGGAGKDTLTGGAGADTFYFASSAEAGDTITDFSADDMIALSGAGFGIADPEDIQFVTGGAPTGQAPAILYDATTGPAELGWRWCRHRQAGGAGGAGSRARTHAA